MRIVAVVELNCMSSRSMMQAKLYYSRNKHLAELSRNHSLSRKELRCLQRNRCILRCIHRCKHQMSSNQIVELHYVEHCVEHLMREQAVGDDEERVVGVDDGLGYGQLQLGRGLMKPGLESLVHLRRSQHDVGVRFLGQLCFKCLTMLKS